MAKFLISAMFLLTGLRLFPQGCNDIFISEYLEGWSNNKAIELYNPTDQPIDLSGYRLERYSNGSLSAADNQRLVLEGVIEPQSTYVIVIDKRDPEGVDQEAPVWDDLQALADWFACPIYDENNTMYFNGNDAMVLRKLGGGLVLDVFGKIGEDPGDPLDGGGWNDTGPDYAWSLNGALAWSANHTLVRDFDVSSGDINAVDAFNVNLGYDSLPANTFDHLGWHECVCTTVGIRGANSDVFSLYPNPADGREVNIKSSLPLAFLEIYNAEGREVFRLGQVSPAAGAISPGQLAPGYYLVRAQGVDGQNYKESLIIR